MASKGGRKSRQQKSTGRESRKSKTTPPRLPAMDVQAEGNQNNGNGIQINAPTQYNSNNTTTNSHNYGAGAVVNLHTEVSDNRKDVVEWLSGLGCLDFLSIHRANLSERHNGTGSWFLAQGKYTAWRNRQFRTLWCHGIPGSGKTILSSIIIGDIEGAWIHPNESTACLFIFFSHQDKHKQTSHRIMLELLRQMVWQQKCVSEPVQQLYDRHRVRATLPCLTELLDAIQHETRQFSKVSLIIDALDECPAHASENTRGEFLQVIRKLPASIQFLITSRFKMPAECGLDPMDEVMISLSEDDLQNYIKGQIQKHGAYNKELSKMDVHTITESISRNTKGMFLLARLHMNDIVSQHTRATMQLALETLPSDIDDTYEKAMQRISSHDISLAERVLLWITFSSRPFTALELRHALATNETVTCSSAIDSNLYHEDHLLSVCVGLVTIDIETRLMRLVHPTAEAYFEKRFAQEHAHKTIAVTCLQYLLLEDLHVGACDSAELRARLHERPFLCYAAQYWGHHARQVQDPEMSNIIVKFLEKEPKYVSYTHILDPHDLEPTSPLWIAAWFGLEEVVNVLLKRDTVGVTEKMHGETALHVAAEEGHNGVMKRLLAADSAQPDIISESGRTPLSLAAENGHDAVVQQLLTFASNEVDPDSKTISKFYDGRTPLSWAAGNGHETIVECLLATKCIDVNSSIMRGPYTGRTALSWAAGNGHVRVVRRLLDKGKADPSLCDGDKRSPLSYAAQNGHEEIVRQLLHANRAESFRQDNVYGRRPVEWAFEWKHEAVVKLILAYPVLDLADIDERTTLSHEAENGHAGLVKTLIDMGADVNSKDYDGLTPLTHAAENGHIAVVKLLLESGADPDSQSTNKRTPASYAAAAGHDEVIRLLIESGASPDFSDRDGRTPLSYAADNGCEAVVSLLLSIDKVNPDSQALRILYAGRTPLSFAAGRGQTKIVDMLLKRGAQVNLETTATLYDKRPPLIRAASNGHEAVAKLLLATGKVEVNEEDRIFGMPVQEWARKMHVAGF